MNAVMAVIPSVTLWKSLLLRQNLCIWPKSRSIGLSHDARVGSGRVLIRGWRSRYACVCSDVWALQPSQMRYISWSGYSSCSWSRNCVTMKLFFQSKNAWCIFPVWMFRAANKSQIPLHFCP